MGLTPTKTNKATQTQKSKRNNTFKEKETLFKEKGALKANWVRCSFSQTERQDMQASVAITLERDAAEEIPRNDADADAPLFFVAAADGKLKRPRAEDEDEESEPSAPSAKKANLGADKTDAEMLRCDESLGDVGPCEQELCAKKTEDEGADDGVSDSTDMTVLAPGEDQPDQDLSGFEPATEQPRVKRVVDVTGDDQEVIDLDDLDAAPKLSLAERRAASVASRTALPPHRVVFDVDAAPVVAGNKPEVICLDDDLEDEAPLGGGPPLRAFTDERGRLVVDLMSDDEDEGDAMRF